MAIPKSLQVFGISEGLADTSIFILNPTEYQGFQSPATLLNIKALSLRVGLRSLLSGRNAPPDQGIKNENGFSAPLGTPASGPVVVFTYPGVACCTVVKG